MSPAPPPAACPTGSCPRRRPAPPASGTAPRASRTHWTSPSVSPSRSRGLPTTSRASTSCARRSTYPRPPPQCDTADSGDAPGANKSRPPEVPLSCTTSTTGASASRGARGRCGSGAARAAGATGDGSTDAAGNGAPQPTAAAKPIVQVHHQELPPLLMPRAYAAARATGPLRSSRAGARHLIAGRALRSRRAPLPGEATDFLRAHRSSAVSPHKLGTARPARPMLTLGA